MRKSNPGFTLVEILVAMVVLAIGLLGMAAMTIMVMRGSRGASDLTAATNICQLKVEELKDVGWTVLGTNASTDPANKEGLPLGGMLQEADLNSQGKELDNVKTELENSGMTPDEAETEADKLGPYKYTRTFVICRGDQYDPATLAPPAGTELGSQASPGAEDPPAAKDCFVDPANNDTRVKWLTCDVEDIAMVKGEGSQEKKIKVLCTWYSREGRCHSVHLDTTVVNL